MPYELLFIGRDLDLSQSPYPVRLVTDLDAGSMAPYELVRLVNARGYLVCSDDIQVRSLAQGEEQ